MNFFLMLMLFIISSESMCFEKIVTQKSSTRISDWSDKYDTFLEREEQNIADLIINEHYEIIPSTQTLAREYAKEIIAANKQFAIDKWFLITADQQTHGVCQSKDKWLSPVGNIYATYMLSLPHVPQNTTFSMNLLHQTVSLSVVETIQSLNNDLITYQFKPKIAWINDVMIDSKKVSGSLCENMGNILNTDYNLYLIGIGLNVNMLEEDAKKVNQDATSVFIQSSFIFNKTIVLNILHTNLFHNLTELLYDDEMMLQEKISHHLHFIDQNVSISLGDNINKGIFIGIDSSGNAKLRDSNNEEKFFQMVS